MFWQRRDTKNISIACTLSEMGYSLAGVKENSEVVFHSAQFFNDPSAATIRQALEKDVDRLNILAQDCHLILLPEQYQLILMDALNVPDAEMAKALRWNLKGLSDYDLDDVALDFCLVPYHGEGEPKAFVSLTPQTALNEKCALLESVFLNVKTVTIADMVLRNILPLMDGRDPVEQAGPIIILSLCKTVRKLHIVYNGLFYLIRELTHVHMGIGQEPPELSNLAFEIGRSIDFCINQLNLPEPKHIFFTPGFYKVVDELPPLGEEIGLGVSMLDLNAYLRIEPKLSLEQQYETFYSITGALATPLELSL